MDKPILQVKNISKKYKFGTAQPYYSLRESLMNTISKPPRLFQKQRKIKHGLYENEFWALRNVSFDVMQGKVVGIIGRNGAGKSTLLKIISRITPPTEGEIIIRGKIASLLNVGTGFHLELTGRENIFLNGAIMGMSRREIKRKLEAIVEFAEVEKFLDTAVKYYSSGMHMRLAFAVASHLEPEILIVDEVLAVGDLWFQQKCLKKMEEENKKGRTVLIVSHDMDTIQSLADGVVLLDGGKTTGLKTIDKAIQQYMYKSEQKSPGYFKAPAQDGSVSEAYILEAKVLNERNVIQTKFHTFEPIFIEITWKNKKGVPVNPNFMLVNQIGMRVMIAADVPIDWDGTKKKKIGTYISRVKIPPNMLNSNEYFIHLSLDRSRPYKKNYHNCPDALTFTVRDSMDERNIARGAFMHVRKDVALWMALDWEWKKIA